MAAHNIPTDFKSCAPYSYQHYLSIQNMKVLSWVLNFPVLFCMEFYYGYRFGTELCAPLETHSLKCCSTQIDGLSLSWNVCVLLFDIITYKYFIVMAAF